MSITALLQAAEFLESAERLTGKLFPPIGLDWGTGLCKRGAGEGPKHARIASLRHRTCPHHAGSNLVLFQFRRIMRGSECPNVVLRLGLGIGPETLAWVGKEVTGRACLDVLELSGEDQLAQKDLVMPCSGGNKYQQLYIVCTLCQERSGRGVGSGHARLLSHADQESCLPSPMLLPLCQETSEVQVYWNIRGKVWAKPGIYGNLHCVMRENRAGLCWLR